MPIGVLLTLYDWFVTLTALLSMGVLLRSTSRRALYFLQMMQQNGYKWREFFRWVMDHFYSRVIRPEHTLLLVVAVSLLFYLSQRLTPTASLLILSVYTLFWFLNPPGSGSPTEGKKPLVFTARAKRLAILFGLLVFFSLYMTLDLVWQVSGIQSGSLDVPAYRLLLPIRPELLWMGLLLVDMTLPFALIMAGWCTLPVERWIQNGFKRQAKKKLATLSNVTVIGITGSYGKTSTKFMLRDLLSERYRVCATPGSYNTPMGICKVINQDLEAHHQVLILEMGARYGGDIGELCDIAQPQISVVTNVGMAHLETFGSQDAIAREKSMLVQRVRPGGLVVLNGEDERVAAMASLAGHARVIRTGESNGRVWAGEPVYGSDGMSFTLFRRNEEGEIESADVEMKLLGEHNVENFLLAAAVALSEGIRLETIAVSARRIEPVEHRLELKKQGDVTIIDDAFNSNPDGAREAIRVLSSFRTGRRILVTPGMVELGDAQEEEHRSLGRMIGETPLEKVYLIGKRQTASILEGIRETGSDLPVEVVGSLSEANSKIRSDLQAGDVILYENDLPDSYDEE
ncbi:MAG: UDP-N-acetylmuramoyl-tripeptide--D-alanyl-D-alanine ligase [Bacteroidota bacterium]